MKVWTTSVYLVFSCLAGLPAWAADGANSDFAWIRDLPGMRPLSHGGGRTVYNVPVDLEARFKSVCEGLTQRGWTVEEDKSATQAPGHRTVWATKGSKRARIVIKADD